MSETLDLTLEVWRQPDAESTGKFHTYRLHGISTHMSFLEMLDVLNEQLIAQGEEPIAFDHCRCRDSCRRWRRRAHLSGRQLRRLEPLHA